MFILRICAGIVDDVVDNDDLLANKRIKLNEIEQDFSIYLNL